VLLAAAPFRLPVGLGDQDAFLLLPLYVVLAATAVALAYRMLRGEHPPAPPFLLALPIAAFVTFASISFLWTWDEREGGISLAFFIFPFVAGLGIVCRSPLTAWLPRALVVTLVALGSLFAAIGLWQANTRTLFFAPSLEVANAYTTFFRVTSLFKDPSLYGRYLVVPIVVLLVIVLARRNRIAESALLTGLIAFLFAGLFFSYSQSSLVALFAVAVFISVVAGDRAVRIAAAATAVLVLAGGGAFVADKVAGASTQTTGEEKTAFSGDGRSLSPVHRHASAPVSVSTQQIEPLDPERIELVPTPKYRRLPTTAGEESTSAVAPPSGSPASFQSTRGALWGPLAPATAPVRPGPPRNADHAAPTCSSATFPLEKDGPQMRKPIAPRRTRVNALWDQR